MDDGAGAAADFGKQVEVGLRELADGIRFWRSRRGWPADFHNSDYEQWERENPRGQFRSNGGGHSSSSCRHGSPPGP